LRLGLLGLGSLGLGSLARPIRIPSYTAVILTELPEYSVSDAIASLLSQPSSHSVPGIGYALILIRQRRSLAER